MPPLREPRMYTLRADGEGGWKLYRHGLATVLVATFTDRYDAEFAKMCFAERDSGSRGRPVASAGIVCSTGALRTFDDLAGADAAVEVSNYPRLDSNQRPTD